MTDQPTDHRAEAERTIRYLEDCVAKIDPGISSWGSATVTALIGIGHALLAGPAERTITVNAPDYVGSHDDLRKALAEMANRGEINAVLRKDDR
jgi:hypothetical protein